MRAYKIIPFLVVILLLAILFASVAPTLRPTPTQLSAATKVSSVAIDEQFTLSGTLTAGITPVSGETITLMRADPSGNWDAAGTATTAANGSFTFTRNESQGVYNYYAYFAGDRAYGTSTSTGVTLHVVDMQKSVISLFASNSNPAVNQPYTIYGVLQDGVTGAPLAGQPITLTISLGQASDEVTMSTTTAANGSYSFTTSSAAQGDYVPSVDFNNPSSGYLESGAMTWITVGNPIPVALTLNITPTNPAVGQSFTMSGTLTDASGNKLPNKGLYIDCQTPDGSWHARANITTNANGAYSWTYNGGEQTPGQYYYEVTFWGDGTYGHMTTVQELAIGNLSPVTLTLNTSIANPAVGQSFTLSGKLTDANGNPLSGKEIDLYDTAVAGGITDTKYTDQNGAYSFVLSENTSGYHLYNLEFIGDQTHAYSIVSLTVTIGTVTTNARS